MEIFMYNMYCTCIFIYKKILLEKYIVNLAVTKLSRLRQLALLAVVCRKMG